MRILLSIFLCLAGVSARADVLACGIFRNGIIGPTNNIPAPPSSGPGDGYEANLISYYKCEDTLTIGGTIVDSVPGGVDLVNDSGDNPSSMTGIIGNALDTRGTHDFGTGWNTTSATSHFALAGHSWTIRYWVYPTSEAGGLDLGDDPSTFGSTQVWQTGYDGGDQFFLKILHGCPGSTSLTISSAHGYAINQWHRVIVWHDLGVQFGIQVDNDAPVVSNQTYDICDVPAQYKFCIVESFLGIDEIAVAKDYVWTSSDRLFDWNGGTGTTYPLP